MAGASGRRGGRKNKTKRKAKPNQAQENLTGVEDSRDGDAKPGQSTSAISDSSDEEEYATADEGEDVLDPGEPKAPDQAIERKPEQEEEGCHEEFPDNQSPQVTTSNQPTKKKKKGKNSKSPNAEASNTKSPDNPSGLENPEQPGVSGTQIIPSVQNILNHHSLVEKFLSLLESGGEQTHLDFKASFVSLDPKKCSDARKTSPREDNSFLVDIMAMYNAINVADNPFQSISGNAEASYLVYGISWTKTEKKSISFKPSDHVRDQSDIQNLVKTRLVPEVTIHQHEIKLNLAELSEDRKKRLDFLSEKGWDQVQTYYLIEIIHDLSKGPLVTRHATDNKNRGERNEIAEIIYTRTQATNRKLDWNKEKDRDLINKVYAKFSAGYKDYPGSLKYISDAIYQSISDHQVQKNQYWSLRVLVLPPQRILKDGDFDEIVSALEDFGWNIVLDFDPSSRDKGFCSKMKRKVLQKNCDVATHKDIASFEGRRCLSLDDVRRGVHYLYLLLRGDTTVDIKEAERFPYLDICNLFGDMFRKWDANIDLEIFCFSTSHECRHMCCELISQIEARWYEIIDKIDCRIVSLSTHQATLMRKFESDWLLGLGSPSELSTFLKDISKEGKKDDESDVRIPSANNQEGGVSISLNQQITIEKVFTLYHMNFGKPEAVENETFENDTRNRFLQGFKLEGSTLYVHDTYGRAYGERTLTTTVETRLRTKLTTLGQCREPSSKSGGKNIITIRHEASAGGTTVGRTILWHLRNEWPCMELKVLKDEAWTSIETALKIIYFEKSRKPMCILIDNSTVGSQVTKKDIKELLLEKTRSVVDKNEVLEFVVLFIEQVLEVSDPVGNTFSLSAKLDQRESKDFDELYSKAKQSLKNTPHNTVPLYGICQFNIRYEKWLINQTKPNQTKLDEVIRDLDVCTQVEKLVLIFVSVLWKYAESPMSNPLLAKELGSKWSSTQKLLGHLETANNVLLISEPSELMDSKHNGIRPPSRYVAEKILQSTLVRQPLQKFLLTFIEMTEASVPISNAIDALVYPIFIQRARIFDERRNISTRELFSNFISDLEEEVSFENPDVRSSDPQFLAAKRTAEKLHPLVEKLADCNTPDSSHCRAMYARYLAKKCQVIDKALVEMRKALSVEPDAPMSKTRLTDVSLLLTAGHLLQIKVRSLKNNRDFRTTAKPLMEDGLALLERAQNRANTGAYTVEAKLRLTYIEHCFAYECGKNFAQFLEMLNQDKDPFVRRAVAVIWTKLNDMDQLMHERHFENSDDLSQVISLEIKVSVLNMLVDTAQHSTNKLLDMAEKTRDMSRCVVAFVMKKKGMNFENFDNDQMMKIVDIYKSHMRELEREHFRQGILAQIYIYNRTAPRFLRRAEDRGSFGGALLAETFATQWEDAYPTDNRAIYLQAVIKLGCALCETTPKRQASEREAQLDAFWETYCKCLEQSRKRSDGSSTYETRKKRVLKWEMSFVIKLSEFPLGVLCPKDSTFSLSKPATYIKFEARAEKTSAPLELLCKALTTRRNRRAVVTIPLREFRRCRTLGSNQPTYEFMLGITPHGLMAESIIAVDGQPTLTYSREKASPDNSPRRDFQPASMEIGSAKK